MKLDLSNSWRGTAFLIDSKKSDTGFVIVQLDDTSDQAITKVFKSGANGTVVSWEPLEQFNGDKLDEYLTLYSNKHKKPKLPGGRFIKESETLKKLNSLQGKRIQKVTIPPKKQIHKVQSK